MINKNESLNKSAITLQNSVNFIHFIDKQTYMNRKNLILHFTVDKNQPE